MAFDIPVRLIEYALNSVGVHIPLQKQLVKVVEMMVKLTDGIFRKGAYAPAKVRRETMREVIKNYGETNVIFMRFDHENMEVMKVQQDGFKVRNLYIWFISPIKTTCFYSSTDADPNWAMYSGPKWENVDGQLCHLPVKVSYTRKDPDWVTDYEDGVVFHEIETNDFYEDFESDVDEEELVF